MQLGLSVSEHAALIVIEMIALVLIQGKDDGRWRKSNEAANEQFAFLWKCAVRA